ncbi:MAG: ABC transporter substrate-binding protein [Clostridia bacterium]|nr:ABC transporter substrate-binding protein [Clostridia bacterium]
MRKTKSIIISVLLILALLVVAGCGGGKGGDAEGPSITVASKTFTENIILGEMLVALLEYHGYPVVNEVGLGETAILRPAIETGEIDVYYEYTGTVLMRQMQHEPVYESEKAYQIVKEWDLEKNNIVWLDYAPANNTYVFMARPGFSDEFGINTISELVEYIENNPDKKFKFAMRDEWYEREDGLPRFAEIYGFDVNKVEVMFVAMGLTEDALKQQQADLGVGFATDGRISAFGLDVLKDDKNCFPVYNPAPTIRKEIIDAYPEIPGILNQLSALLTNEALMELNMLVDLEGLDAAKVARDFLQDNGLIK